jgi:5-methylcytosine-specific restriction endonuclease McrA
MPRRSLDAEQKAFVRNNADKGGNWLAEALQVDRAAIYQYAYETGFSVKKRKKPSDGSLKKDRFAWPRKYYKYKKYLVMRDGLRCHYCESIMTYDEAQVDHILAKARGGSDAPHNLVLACPSCNNIKSTLCYSCPEFREAIQK